MKVSGRVVSLQLDESGLNVLKRAGIEAEEALSALIIDELVIHTVG